MLQKVYTILLKSSILGYICVLLAFNSLAQVTYEGFIEEPDLNRKSFIALRLYDRYVREDIDSIKIVAINLLSSTYTADPNEFTFAAAKRLMGGFEIRRGQIKSGIEKLTESAGYFEVQMSFDMASEIYNDLGHAMYLEGEYDEAVLAYRKSIRLGREGMDETSLYNAELGLGKTMIALGDTVRGESIIRHYKDEAISDSKFEAAADAYGYLGQIAEEQKNIDLSNSYLLKSYQLGMKSASLIHKSHALTNRAIVLVNAEQYDSAEYCFIRAMEIREELTNPRPLIESYYNLGSFYTITGEGEKGRAYFLLSADLAKEMNYFVEEIDALLALKEYGLDANDEWVSARIIQLNQMQDRQSGLDEEILAMLFSGESDYYKSLEEKKKVRWEMLIGIVFVIATIILYHSVAVQKN